MLYPLKRNLKEVGGVFRHKCSEIGVILSICRPLTWVCVYIFICYNDNAEGCLKGCNPPWISWLTNIWYRTDTILVFSKGFLPLSLWPEHSVQPQQSTEGFKFCLSVNHISLQKAFAFILFRKCTWIEMCPKDCHVKILGILLIFTQPLLPSTALIQT